MRDPRPQPRLRLRSRPSATPGPLDGPSPSAAPSASDAPSPSSTPGSAPPSAEPTPTATPSSVADTPTSDHIVTFASTTSGGQRSEILAAAGADVIDTIPALRLAVIRVPDGSSVNSSCCKAAPASPESRATPSVPPRRYRATRGTTPSGPFRWTGWDDVYGTVHPSGSAVVAVLDTGVDGGQPDLAGELVPGTSVIAGGDPTVDPNGHERRWPGSLPPPRTTVAGSPGSASPA